MLEGENNDSAIRHHHSTENHHGHQFQNLRKTVTSLLTGRKVFPFHENTVHSNGISEQLQDQRQEASKTYLNRNNVSTCVVIK